MTAEIQTLNTHTAAIMAFGQSDAATLFMESVSPDLKKFFLRSMEESLSGFSAKIFAEVEGVLAKNEQAAVAKAIIARQVQVFMKGYASEVDKYIKEKSVGPVVSSIDGLGKEDMAKLAESMVELASLKKRVSREVETVGGPIDVAVVTKIDGFIWIKRKHYFDFSLNRAFYSRYHEKRFALGEHDDANKEG